MNPRLIPLLLLVGDDMDTVSLVAAPHPGHTVRGMVFTQHVRGQVHTQEVRGQVIGG